MPRDKVREGPSSESDGPQRGSRLKAVMNQHIPANRALAERSAREIEGEVLFDRATRGRYSTDASIYQIEPVGVVVPKTDRDVRIAAEIAREAGVPLLPRGGGTSQSGQTVGRALVDRLYAGT